MRNKISERVRVPFPLKRIFNLFSTWVFKHQEKTMDQRKSELKESLSALNQTLFGVRNEEVDYNNASANTSACLIQDRGRTP